MNDIRIGPIDNEQRTYLGDVLMYRKAMVILRDVSMYLAYIEFEDGTKQWVGRSEVRLI